MSNSSVTSPLTGTADVDLLELVPTGRLIADWKRIYSLDITSEFHGHEAISVYRCRQTGLRFFRPIEAAGSAELYRNLQRVEAYYSDALAWEHFTAFAAMRPGSKALEVGCGTGPFVQYARERGVAMQGIDFNPDAVTAAQAKQRPVEMRDLASLGAEHADSFDCVCSFQVLEHLTQPGKFLIDCLRLLKPNGVLIAAVPNDEGYLRDYYGILNYPPHHMSRWTTANFKSLETLYGVRLTMCRPEPLSSSHLALWLEAYHHQLTARWAPFLSEARAASLAKTVMKMGLRKLVPGAGLYAQFEKVGPPSAALRLG